MHNLSRASGCAICRLLQSEMNGSSECDYEELEKEIAAFAEMARKNLCLDNSSLTAAVMFAQPLVKKWVPRWKFAFTIGVALGTKFTTEGFWTVDIINHLTDEFSLEALKKGEEIALMDYDFGANMRQRWTNFRNALIHVAVENPLPGSIAAQPVLLPGEEAPLPLHVMVVDDSPHVLKLHESLIRHLVPEARIQTCCSVREAVDYWRTSRLRSDQIHLVLLDLNLSGIDGGNDEPPVANVLDGPNGLDVAHALEDLQNNTPQYDFAYRPLIALVTSYATRIQTEVPPELSGKVKRSKMLEGSALPEVGQEVLQCMVSFDVPEVCIVSAGEVLESGALRKRKAQTSPTRG
ncbi:MAG: hypothetical protein SGPRY_003984 [Prymnesium sp.]